MAAHYFTYQSLKTLAGIFKEKALAWANNFPVVAFYENNHIPYPYSGFDNLLAVSNNAENLVAPTDAFGNLHEVLSTDKSLLCGFLTYDLKNQIEKLDSHHPDHLGFPLIYFFRPEILIYFREEGVEINTEEESAKELLNLILTPEIHYSPQQPIRIFQRVSHPEYITKIKSIQNHILEGDVYEINFCHEFFSPAAVINPIATFWALNAVSPMPFAGFFKLQDKFLLCASPERSLKKEGNKLISQPIKGTVKRSSDKFLDELLRHQLRNSEKEISENMMIMDLVRNDLSKSSEVGSVQVEEMFGIYGFRHLYQMITTVTSTIHPACSVSACIKNAFPMGSMTGAPKIRAMQLIEDYEDTRRGLFSGSIGYIKPDGDFDFNVVIRSLQYNASSGYLSFLVGSAITYDSDPEQEYAECLLKAEAILNILRK